ncbi:MAG: hypothetical protein JW902_08965 [Syntrophaceae bacterium]|nr:hypothetical protein [Syntrophaceae bacterium]
MPRELMPLAVEKNRAKSLKQDQVDQNSLPFIQSIVLEPNQPTRMDTLTAEVALKQESPDLNFRYIWKVNDRIVPDATGNTLELSECQVRDVVSVTVIPSDGERIGLPVEGPLIAIHVLPPTLELEPSRNKIRNGDVIDLQLISSHPDCPVVIFALADPLVNGMTIDQRTGKITWTVLPDQKGLIRFGASVEDDTHTVKVTKEFEIQIE